MGRIHTGWDDYDDDDTRVSLDAHHLEGNEKTVITAISYMFIIIMFGFDHDVVVNIRQH